MGLCHGGVALLIPQQTGGLIINGERRRGQLAERRKHSAVPQFGPLNPETPLPLPAHPGSPHGEEQNRSAHRWPEAERR